MRGTELRDLLGRLEETPAPEPSALFVAKLEAELRTTDQTIATETPRPRRRRALVAAAPIAALAAAAAAAAATLLPSDPHPRQVNTADPGVTAPAPSPETPSTSTPEPTPTPTTVVVAPPWLPPVTAPAPPTTGPSHAASAPFAPRPADGPAPTIVGPGKPVTTTVPPPTTTVPAPEALSLHCTPGVAGGNPIVGCGWNQSTSSSFAWYRVWREVQGSSLVVVYQSDNRSTVSYYDQAVQSGTNYYYKVDITDAAGNVIGTSNVVAVSCC